MKQHEVKVYVDGKENKTYEEWVLREIQKFENIEEMRKKIDINNIIKVKKCPKCNSRKFMVDSKKQMYYCKNCKIGGDIFTYIMQTQDKTFSEVVEEIEEKQKNDKNDKEKILSNKVFKGIYPSCDPKKKYEWNMPRMKNKN